MKMNKSGFTLIELLAVIVILAVIALIASPIILGIIEDSRESSRVRSVEQYAKAIEKVVTTYMTLNPSKTTISICTGTTAGTGCDVDATITGRDSGTPGGGAAKVVTYSGSAVDCASATYDPANGIVTVTSCSVGNDTTNKYTGDTKDGIEKVTTP